MNRGLSTATCHLGPSSAGLSSPPEVCPRGAVLSSLLLVATLVLAEAGVLVLLAGVGCLEVGSE